MSRTIQDELDALRDQLITSVGNVNGMIASTAVPEDLIVEPFDEEGLQAKIARRIQEIYALDAARASEDAMIADKRKHLQENEENIRALSKANIELEKFLEEEKEKLANVKSLHLSFQMLEIEVSNARIKKYGELLLENLKMIASIERAYPDLKQKLEDERNLLTAHRSFLMRFITVTGDDGCVRYVSLGTPTPTLEAEAAEKFLTACIKDANNEGLIVPAELGASFLFVAYDKSRWTAAYPEIPEGAHICSAFTAYEKEIQRVYEKKQQVQAEKDVAAGFLLTPQEVEQQKKDPDNRGNVLNMIERKSGYCFVPVEECKERTNLLLYVNVAREMRVEYVKQNGLKTHALRVSAVTVPQLVQIFFHKHTGEKLNQIFYFNCIHDEVSLWRTHSWMKWSLAQAVRKAEFGRKERNDVATIQDTSDLGNDLKTVHELADGEAGTAVISISKYQGMFDVCFRLVSDGITVKLGSATERSAKIPLCEELQGGMPVVTFFARAKDGMFEYGELQKFIFFNAQDNAKWVSHANVDNLVMLGESGCDGTFILKVAVTERTVMRDPSSGTLHEVGYVVTRVDDNIIFVDGLTRYSQERFVQQGFAFNTPYALQEMHGFMLHILQRVFSGATKTPYDDFPEHLKGARAKAHSAALPYRPVREEVNDAVGDEDVEGGDAPAV